MALSPRDLTTVTKYLEAGKDLPEKLALLVKGVVADGDVMQVDGLELKVSDRSQKRLFIYKDPIGNY